MLQNRLFFAPVSRSGFGAAISDDVELSASGQCIADLCRCEHSYDETFET